MRALNIALVVGVILIGVVAARHEAVTPAHANLDEAHDVVVYGFQIALPDGMTTFPAELVPLP
jgi:hypothetical protein